MFVIDITRCNDQNTNDMLVGKDSMEAKSKTINYIIDYAFANYSIYIDKDLLDQELNIKEFSLKKFLENNYSKTINDDLLIQSILTDKDNCFFVKHFDQNVDSMPNVYIFNKKEIKNANSTFVYLVNDSLIKKYSDDLEYYEEIKLDSKNKIFNYSSKDINCETISLYNGGLFLEELLNNSTSLNQLRDDKYIKI